MNNDTTASEIEWVDAPPPRIRGVGMPSVWGPRLKELANHPGSWAKFGPYKHSSNANSVKVAARKLGYQVEVTNRLIDGQNWVYIRVLAS